MVPVGKKRRTDLFFVAMKIVITIAFIALIITSVLCASIAQDRPATAPQSDCPQFSVEANWEMVKAGDLVEFTVRYPDLKEAKVPVGKFEWTVSRGTIVSGQGTAKIVVLTSKDMLTVPTSTPTPLPDPGEHGYIIHFGGHRRTVEIKATAKFVSIENCSGTEASATVQVGTRSISPNKPADVTRLKLSAQNLVASCEPGREPRADRPASKDMVVDAEVSVLDPENDVLTFSYKVSGGRIIGTGQKVKWDLTGVSPGTYTITVGADDGCGICGTTKTEEVTVIKCEQHSADVVCPMIDIVRSEVIDNESVFTASVSGGSRSAMTYTWTVLGGEIIDGQGTPSIKVKTRPGGSVTVKIGGFDPLALCADSVTTEF